MAAPRVFASHLLWSMVLGCVLGAQGSGFSPEELDQDVVSQHMSKLYDKYNRENRLAEGNTVRSFRASPGA